MEKSPLASLPAEIRNTIWEIVVQRPAPISFGTIHHNVALNEYHKTTKGPGGTASMVAILQVCRQTRDECSQLLYASNTFQFEIRFDCSRLRGDRSDYTSNFKYFHSMIGMRNNAALRHILVEVKRDQPLGCHDRPDSHTHDYLTTLAERGERLHLDIFQCNMRVAGKDHPFNIDLLDLGRPHADASRLMRERRARGPGTACTRQGARLWSYVMSRALKEMERTAPQI